MAENESTQMTEMSLVSKESIYDRSPPPIPSRTEVVYKKGASMSTLPVLMIITALSGRVSMTNSLHTNANPTENEHHGGSFTYLNVSFEQNERKQFNKGLADASKFCGENKTARVQNETVEIPERPMWPAGHPQYDAFPVAHMSLLPDSHEPTFLRVDFVCQANDSAVGSIKTDAGDQQVQ